MGNELNEIERKRINSVINELSRQGYLDDNSKGGFEPFEPFEINGANELPSFPIECLPDKIRGFVESVTECLQVPVDMVAVSAITVISLCVQGKYEVNPKPGWTEPLNLYTLIVARPSERKSPTAREMTEVVYKYVEEENERRNPAIEEYKLKSDILTKKVNSLKKTIAEGRSKKNVSMDDVLETQKELDELEVVNPLQLIVDDITPESLAVLLMDNNERMSIISAEGGIFGLAAGRYNDKTNIDILLKAYSGDPATINRIGRKSIYLKHPLLTILLFVQPSIIREIMENSEFSGRGFLARFLYTIPVTTIGSRTYETKAISEVEKKRFNDLAYNLLSIPDMFGCRTIRFSEGAHILASDFFNQIEGRLIDDLEEIDSWAGKFHGQVMRIAGILHCIKYELDSYNVLLEETTMREAITIGYYFLEHAKTAFAIMGYESPVIKEAKYLISKIDLELTKGSKVTKRNLYQLCNGRFQTVEDMKPGLDILVERGYIRIYQQKTGGRPTEIIEINPEYERQKVQKVQKEGDIND